MSIPSIIRDFNELKADKKKTPFQQLCSLCGCKAKRAEKLIAIFGQIQEAYLPVDKEIGNAYSQTIHWLRYDVKQILSINYQNLLSSLKLAPMPKCSWNQKHLGNGVDNDEEMARSRLLLFLQTSAMPHQLARALDLAEINGLHDPLERQNTTADDLLIDLFDMLKDPPEDKMLEDINSIQLVMSRTAALAAYPKFISFLDSFLEWQNCLPQIAENFIEKCKLLRAIINTNRVVLREQSPSAISFQEYLIEKTKQQIQQFCPLDSNDLHTITLQFKYSDYDRRTVSFFIFFLQDFEDRLGVELTLPDESLFKKLSIVLERISFGLDPKTVKLMQALLYVKVFNELVGPDKCAVFKWAYRLDNLSLFARFVQEPTPYIRSVFSFCYTRFIQKYSLDEQNITIFLTLVHCHYYLELDSKSLNFFLEHLTSFNYAECLKEIEQYAACLKITPDEDPRLKRKYYLKKTIAKQSERIKDSTWEWKTFKKKSYVRQFLQQVERCIQKTLPISLIFKAFSLPFYRKNLIAIVKQLDDKKMRIKIDRFFLYDHYLEVMDLMAKLQDSENAMLPGMTWLVEDYSLTLPFIMGTITHHLQEAVFPSPKFLKKIDKSSLIFFPAHSRFFPEAASLQNALTFFTPGNTNGLAFLANWHASSPSFLELTFLFSAEVPRCRTIRMTCPLKKNSKPFYKDLLHSFIKNLGRDTNKNLKSAGTIEEEFQMCMDAIAPNKDAVWTYKPGNQICELFLFVRQLKIEARYALASLFTNVDKRECAEDPMILASKKNIYVLPDKLSLLPPSLDIEQYCLPNSAFQEEFAALAATRHKENLEGLFTVQMADGKSLPVDVFYHPRPIHTEKIKDVNRNFNEVIFSMAGISYAVRYGDFWESEHAEKMLRFQLLMLQSHYYARPSSLIWGTKVKQVEKFDYQFSLNTPSLSQGELS